MPEQITVTFLCAISDGSYELERQKECFIISTPPGSFGEEYLAKRGIREMSYLFWWIDDPKFRANEFYPDKSGLYRWDGTTTYNESTKRNEFTGAFTPLVIPAANWYEQI